MTENKRWYMRNGLCLEETIINDPGRVTIVANPYDPNVDTLIDESVYLAHLQNVENNRNQLKASLPQKIINHAQAREVARQSLLSKLQALDPSITEEDFNNAFT